VETRGGRCVSESKLTGHKGKYKGIMGAERKEKQLRGLVELNARVGWAI